MQNTRTIAYPPLLLMLLLSAGLHAALLWHRDTVRITPPRPLLQSGKTVVQLTLTPSAPAPMPESQPAEPEPQPEIIEETPPPITPDPAPTERVKAPKPKPIEKEIPHPAETQPQDEPEITEPPSIEQDATTETDKGVTSDAQTLGETRPEYPLNSRRRGEEGTVVLSIVVRTDGSAGEIKLIQSSGYRRLDTAMLNAARTARYAPALKNGQPIESTFEKAYTFKLTND